MFHTVHMLENRNDYLAEKPLIHIAIEKHENNSIDFKPY